MNNHAPVAIFQTQENHPNDTLDLTRIQNARRCDDIDKTDRNEFTHHINISIMHKNFSHLLFNIIAMKSARWKMFLYHYW